LGDEDLTEWELLDGVRAAWRRMASGDGNLRFEI
jgi:hypothetical protein